MSALVFVEIDEKEVKKSSLEAVSYGKSLGGDVLAICFGDLTASGIEKIGKAGANKLIQVKEEKLAVPNIMAYSTAIAETFDQNGCDTLVLAKSSLGDPVSARVAIKVGASVVPNVSGLPEGSGEMVVDRSIYTGKAVAKTLVKGAKKVLTIKKNTVPILEDGSAPEVVDFKPTLKDEDFKVKVTKTEKATGEVLLPEADIVVSGGRGMGGPEKWSMLEDLAKVLGAATGCSKPVSDMNWRPHHEHVGQTGIKVSPSLYIAVGISGAIQHLAGVNSSKYILVINKDPEAPFFKAADFGIVGDAFDIVPKLTEAIKAKKD
ncbi:MAG: electron transfer flavoprotein subunit alpha/FixB family protein [Cyclobacteriaceae bacterium]|nr:electron transfer flavoprotein subunit alpha/FixB family protein [Cyclobacteriaceae bacterium SS2]